MTLIADMQSYCSHNQHHKLPILDHGEIFSMEKFHLQKVESDYVHTM